jgi:hypothetical protein
MLLVVLFVAIAAPVFADEGGVANENAKWGQDHKACYFVDSNNEVYGDEDGDDISGYVKMVKGWAEGNDETFGEYINKWLK